MIKQVGNKVYRRFDKELLCIEPWGKNSFRIRATQRHEFMPDDISALLEPVPCKIKVYERGTDTVIENGKIICEITRTGKLRFLNQTGKLLLEEYERIRGMSEEGRKEFNSALEIFPRTFEPHQSVDNFKLTVRFEPVDGEKLYGMGQYQQPYLDVKGCTLELAHRNSQASVPFVLSSNGYGLLWNNPAIGTVTFGKNITEWTAKSTKQMDYWITAGDTPAEIEEAYADATGKVPMMPEYGMGFWQCKLRYQTQDEILEVAREYKKRGLPIDVIVADFFHWPHQGDWKFDSDYWPDPAGMVKELKEMGIELMVSIWPTVDAESENYEEMEELGYLTRSEFGKRIGQLGDACIIDVTHPEGRSYVWNKIKENYYEKGIKIFWLDEAEPELTGYEYQHYRFYRGADMEIGNVYPKEYARMAYEGMEAEGQKNIVNLLRCAWAGSQKYGTLVWSGDIDSSFRSLRNQLSAGLNMGIAGLPWWTTDIGGFHGGNIYDSKFHEILIRWFEFGTFCPVMRLHGFREPFKEPLGTTGGGKHISGAENEVWSYGDEVYEICKKYMNLREKMRPYVRKLMKAAHEKGTPIMRPLFYDFPEDKIAWEIEDEYMFGPDLLVAPILYADARERKVYLPDGMWRNICNGEMYQGKQRITVAAPIDQIPVFVKNGTLEEL
ncbi:MAG: glycoside hydrolase family 31 protein [Blautia sp.]